MVSSWIVTHRAIVRTFCNFLLSTSCFSGTWPFTTLPAALRLRRSWSVVATPDALPVVLAMMMVRVQQRTGVAKNRRE